MSLRIPVFFNWLVLIRYKQKFGFPFVICAKENKAATILAAIEKRLNHEKLQELQNGIEEVKKISTLRIQQLVTD